MAHCPACGSHRIRNGYRLAPLPLRALGIRELLCDYCNRQFRAFSLEPRSRWSERKPVRDHRVRSVRRQLLRTITQPPLSIPFDRHRYHHNLPITPFETAAVPAVQLAVDLPTPSTYLGKDGSLNLWQESICM
jgi:hypothetical protein